MPSYNLTAAQQARAERLAADAIWARVPAIDLAGEIIFLRDEVDSLRAFKAGVDEALNSGDGSYRP